MTIRGACANGEQKDEAANLGWQLVIRDAAGSAAASGRRQQHDAQGSMRFLSPAKKSR